MEIEETIYLTEKNEGKTDSEEETQEKQIDINSSIEEEDQEVTKNLLKAY